MSNRDSEKISDHVSVPSEENGQVSALNMKNIKISAFLFVLFVLINSDVFIDKILSTNSSYVEGRYATSSGVVIQGIVLTVCYIIIFVLVEHDFI
jgi:hypothetical protein